MPREQEYTENYWGWCSGWLGIPYPCKKTRTVKKWCYDFSFLNVSYRFFYTDYWGCEHNVRYSWRSWAPPFRIEDFTLYFYTKCFRYRLKEQESCSPTGVVNFVGNILDGYIKDKVNEALKDLKGQQ